MEGCTFAGRRAHIDFPGVFLDDAVTHGKSEAGATAAGFGGEERVKDAMDVFAGNPGAGIRHFNFHAAVMRRGADGQHSPAGHGVTRVQEKVQEDLLQQVFLNLFLNARDAMPGGGMLAVRTAAHNGSVEIEVADTGAGIAREHIHRIFDPFFTTKASGRGTGLGLSVSYGIIKEHSGKIDVRSTPGKGTSFHVEFPAVRKAVHV